MLDSLSSNSEIRKFVLDNTGTDVSKLALLKNPFPEFDWKEILNQITSRTKAKDKLPTWFGNENVIYPAKISIEQASSEITAAYKSRIVSGENLIDLTGGFGVDDYYFSKNVKNVTHCEINSELSEIVKYNFEQLNVDNIVCLSGDSHEMLQTLQQKFSWLYIDPSRRSDSKGKVFMLKDCLPNVVESLDFYFSFSDNILIKTAPLLDISAGLSELKNVKAIHIVAVKNEVKELLWEIEKDYSAAITIKTVDFSSEEKSFDFELDLSVDPDYGLPEKYLFEPNSAIMKSGGFAEVAVQFELRKLHRHSHLYTSNELVDFPGRIFEIAHHIPFNKSGMKQLSDIEKANITTRNFPDSVETLRKKWKIAEGGNVYAFFTTDSNNNKIVLICTKIQ